MRISTISLGEVLFGALLLTGASVEARGDLGRVYKATLQAEKRPQGKDWVATEDNVWELKQFVLVYRSNFHIRTGPANVVFGKHGTNVLWAAVIPDVPGEILTAPSGKGEKVTSIFLRFHPSLVRQLFSPALVVGPGPPEALILARRIYQYKIGGSWQHSNMPVVPAKNFIVVDCETTAGNRRFFMIDTSKRSVKEENAFLSKSIPKLAYGEFEDASPVEVFDQVWQAFDREYAMFTVKPKVDWEKLRDRYRPLAAKTKGRYEAVAVVALLLSHLEDLHVSVRIEDESVWCYNRYRFLNANYSGLQAVAAKLIDTGNAVRWGKTRDNLGYIVVMNLLHKKIPETFDKVLVELKETRGLVLDLRFNGGGDELMARSLAGRFLEKPEVYSYNQYRSGPKHTDLGRKFERVVEPCGPWTYKQPVVVLCGERTMSSAESFVCMMAKAPRATLMGDRTAGSSANPRQLELPGKITVTLPRWLDMDHTDKPIDRVGVQPDIRIDLPPIKYGSSEDPVTRAALRLLRREK